jgi:DNA-directed RNA polymerase specialized sigma24 family protein
VSISGVLGGICSEDLTSRIAARMGCTSRTVRRRILAAVKALRASLPALLEEIREVA